MIKQTWWIYMTRYCPLLPGLSPAAELPLKVGHCASFPRHPLSATPPLLSSPVSSFLSLTARTNHPSLACSSVYFHIPTNIRFSPPQVRRPSTAASRCRGAASNQISYSQVINTPRVWVWRRATQAHAPQIAHQNPNELNCRAVDHR